MKKFMIFICALLASVSFADAQETEKMVVRKTDGTQVEYKVSDIEKVFFLTEIFNPCNPQGAVGTPVDLGLSCLWANWNVGASSIYDAGGLFGWADPEGTKATMDIDDYPSANPPSSICGTQYDIARVRWGGDWRMPTYEEMRELVMECEWSLSVKNGEKFLRVTGPNENSILIPITGYRQGTEVVNEDSYYFSGTLCEEDETTDHYSYGMCIDMTKSTIGMTALNRMYGFGIRPVCDKKVNITVTTGSASDITESSAKLSGTVSGVDEPIECGIIYGTSSNVSETNGTKKSTTSKGSFSITLSNLSSETKYYYRAYALYAGKYTLGEVKNFTTKAGFTGTLNGHEWVDLGLPSGTKWATCNVGASSPEEYGDYYAWGETRTKSVYSWSTYMISESQCGTYADPIRSGSIAGTSYDAAYVKWGAGWQLPGFIECNELINGCTYNWTNQNGVYGIKLTSKYNGATIFFPASGGKGGFEDKIGKYCYFWTYTRSGDFATNACRLRFSNVNICDIGSRYQGYAIRAITK